MHIWRNAVSLLFYCIKILPFGKLAFKLLLSAIKLSCKWAICFCSSSLWNSFCLHGTELMEVNITAEVC